MKNSQLDAGRSDCILFEFITASQDSILIPINQFKRPFFKVADVLSITKPIDFDCLVETLINLRQRTLPASNLMKAARIKTSHNLHCLNKNLVGGCCFICSAYAYRRKVEQNFWQQYYYYYYRLYSGYLYHACTVDFFI